VIGFLDYDGSLDDTATAGRESRQEEQA